MSLGVLLGLIAVPFPSVGTISMGLAGGPLIVALILGRYGRIGPLSWHIPLAANLTLRYFGLMLFLAAVGLGAGAPFVETVSRTGFTLLGIGAAILLATMLDIMALGQWVFKLNTDDLFGVVSGAAGDPAVLSYANQTLTSERVEVAYSTIFPSMTILNEDRLRAGRHRDAGRAVIRGGVDPCANASRQATAPQKRMQRKR